MLTRESVQMMMSFRLDMRNNQGLRPIDYFHNPECIKWGKCNMRFALSHYCYALLNLFNTHTHIIFPQYDLSTLTVLQDFLCAHSAYAPKA